MKQQQAEAGIDLFNIAFLHSQVFWTGVSFAFLLFILVWKVLPIVTKSLDDRAAKIKGDLTAAEESRREAEQALLAYERKLAKAKAESTDIINTARAESKNIIDERLKELDAEITRRRDDANKSISSAKAKAMKELQGEVAGLVVQVTEKLLTETIDAKKAASITQKAVKSLVN